MPTTSSTPRPLLVPPPSRTPTRPPPPPPVPDRPKGHPELEPGTRLIRIQEHRLPERGNGGGMVPPARRDLPIGGHLGRGHGSRLGLPGRPRPGRFHAGRFRAGLPG